MKLELHQIGDELGPQMIAVVRDPGVGLDGVVVVDNTACGISMAVSGWRQTERVLPRQAAVGMARARLEAAARYRGASRRG